MTFRKYAHFSERQSDSVQRSEMLLPVQSRMARAALGLSVRQLAALAAVSHDTIVRLEAGDTLKESTVNAVRSALEAAGVEFIPENGGGAGVRLKKAIENG